MLKSITIKNLVLIDEAKINFPSQFSVLTGETGAGKSIILNAIAMLIGQKPKKNLVRVGQEKAIIHAEFAINAEIITILKDKDIDFDGDNIQIKAVLDKNNKYKNYINGEQVNKKTIEEVGSLLAEQQGQKEQFYLADKTYQLNMLDKFAKNISLNKQLAEKYKIYAEYKSQLQQAEKRFTEAVKEEDYLRHVLAEFNAIKYQLGEEQELADKRRLMQQTEKLGTSVKDALDKLTANFDISKAIVSTQRILQEYEQDIDEAKQVNGQLEEAYNSLEGAIIGLEDLNREQGFDVNELEATEARLFAIRALARKYGCHADGLVEVEEDIAKKISSIENGEQEIKRLKKLLEQERQVFVDLATGISNLRKKEAKKLEAKVLQELKDLHLKDAKFKIEFKQLQEPSWNILGFDELEFKVSTNPGTPLATLSETASGGEVSRIVLALKIALAKVSNAKLIIFDEIDTGTGGAVADSIGKKLALLGQNTQVLAISHSPQVAANANTHFFIYKQNIAGQNITNVNELKGQAVKNELARMLSGEEISPEAQAAAEKLLLKS